MTLTPTHEPPSDEVLREVALTRDEYHFAADLLDRPPNPVELGIIGGMWSEHCGYKHSRPLLGRLPSEGPHVLIGPGEENAGAVDIGHGLAIVMKVESHNHPSAVEPFQGAATGVGGILRDIFTMGARPIALLDSLRFGPLDDRRGRFLANGIVGGIGWYGNCMGVPTVGGEVQVSASYRGNPLVNAMCVGLIEHSQLTSAAASGAGNELILVGADTGRDGIHGATFASVDDPEASHRGVVQVGNPFMEKLLLEACLEVLQTTDAILGLQDLGATGLTSSSVESAGRGGTGVVLHLEHVARRASGMTPYEVMLSESQERMLVVAARGRAHEVQRVFDKWGLHSDVIGEVTETGLLDVRDNGQSAASLPITMLTDAPTYTYPVERPAYLDEVGSLDLQDLPEPNDPTSAFLQHLASPHIASRRPLSR
ncbi:MAG: phosphoribosylformylglycinamidine synthase II, partial [Chloroflexi bacterium]|nr:phosphoribosylformylglycinamidine synthase II [Chloroflexota bacterium]